MSGDTAFHSAAVRPESLAEASSFRVMSPSRAARLEPVESISAPRLAIRASMSSRVSTRISVQDPSGPPDRPNGFLLLRPGVVAVHRPVQALVDDRQGCVARLLLGQPERLRVALGEPVQDPVDRPPAWPRLPDADPHPVEVLRTERRDDRVQSVVACRTAALLQP